MRDPDINIASFSCQLKTSLFHQTSYTGRPGIPRGCGMSLELITDNRQISVVISDIPAQSEVAAVQCVYSRRLNIGLTVLLLLLLYD